MFEDNPVPRQIKSPLTELKERGYANPRRALASIKRGLAESAAGQVHDLGDFRRQSADYELANRAAANAKPVR